MAPKAKASPRIAPIPAVHSFPPINALPDGMDLRDAIEKGYAEGLSRREQVRENVDKPEYLERLLREPESIREIAELAKSYGATKFAPLARGAESSVFASNSPKVFKIGPQGLRFEYKEPYNYELPSGVWGVLPNERTHILSPDRDWNVFAQDRVSTDDVGRKDLGLVLDALNQQGFGARDAHDENIGKIPGKIYKPVLFDGYVEPRPTRMEGGRLVDDKTGMPILGKDKFRPPTTRPWILAALAAGAGTANASTRKDRNQDWEQFLAPDGRPPVPWSPSQDDTGTLERYTGSDWDMAISPNEYQSWYSGEKSGYGGPEHQQFIANLNEAFEQPSIPEEVVRAQEQSSGYKFPGYEGGDLSAKQFLTAVPYMLQGQAFQAYMQDQSEENKNRYMEIASTNKANPPEAMGDSPESPYLNPYSADAYAELTGQRYNRAAPQGVEGANMLRSALQAGVRGSQFAEDNTIPQGQYEAWQQQYGEEADRMLPQGAEQNAMRERVYDLANTMSDDPQHAAKGVDSISAAMMLPFKPGEDDDPTGNRYANLMDRSAPRGRMAISSERYDLGRPKEDGKPYVVDADAFGRYDPQSFAGLRNVLGSASFPISAAQQAFYPLLGDIGSQLTLQQGLGDTKPREFIGDTFTNQGRVAQIRPENVSPQQARETENWWDRWKGAKRDYYSANIGPKFADAYNAIPLPKVPMQRTYLSGAANDTANLPGDISESVIQSGMTLIPGLVSAAKGAPLTVAAKSVGYGMADEMGENIYQSPMLDPANAGDYFRPAKDNSYIRRPVDVNDKQAYEQELSRSSNEWNEELGGQYEQYLRQKRAAPFVPTQSSPSRSTLIPMLRQ